MEHRTRTQENMYLKALGYAWGRKDATPYGSDSGRKAMVTGAMDFAAWYAATSTEDGTNLEQAWQAFTQLSPQEQRKLAEEFMTLPHIPTY